MVKPNDDIQGLPVPGYRAQRRSDIDLVTANKHAEERILRTMDALKLRKGVDLRWLAIARTDLEKAFMALNRAIFRPDRVVLPDEPQLPEGVET